MTSHRRFEQDLPDLLAGLAPGPTPDYRDDIVQQTARMRQRPAWMFPERWIPMTAVTSRAAGASRLPWRAVGLVAVLLIALVIGAVLVAGSQSRVPRHSGRRRTASSPTTWAATSIASDPVTGTVTAIVTGPATDVRPVWSRDGTHFAFERKVEGSASLGKLFVTGADGRGLIALTPDAMVGLRDYAFSPDGRELLFTSGAEGYAKLWIAKTDGSGVRPLDVNKAGVVGPAYRAPDGAEIVFVGAAPIEQGNGVYAVDLASGKVRTILDPVPGVGRDYLRLSPDGTRSRLLGGHCEPGPEHLPGPRGHDGWTDRPDATDARGSDLRGRADLVQRQHPSGRHARVCRARSEDEARRGPRGREWHGRRVRARSDRMLRLDHGVGARRLVDPDPTRRFR